MTSRTSEDKAREVCECVRVQVCVCVGGGGRGLWRAHDDELGAPECTLVLVHGGIDLCVAGLHEVEHLRLLLQHALHLLLHLELVRELVVEPPSLRAAPHAVHEARRERLVRPVHLLVEDDVEHVLVLPDPQHQKHVPAALVGGAGGDARALPEVVHLVLAALLPALHRGVELAAEGLVFFAQIVRVHLFALLGRGEGAAAGEVRVVGEEMRRLPVVVVELGGRERPKLLVCEHVWLHGGAVWLRFHGEEGRLELRVDEEMHQTHAVVAIRRARHRRRSCSE
mmetsp:Transcript_14332/g.28571  ORF Transcript_14332/g.28571 Transcript_14332/m.28571 type:complete len:282 (-) Transcript_14332:454-1299(-)